MKCIAVPALFSAALLSGAASAETIISIPQDSDFQEANMRWTGATAKGYDARMAVKVIEGKLALCGVGVVTNIQVSSAIKNGLRGGYVKLNGKKVIKNFTFFAKARSLSALDSTKANCKVSNTPLPAKIDNLQVRYGDATFRN